MDLYCRLGDELRALFKVLFDPSREEMARREMENILRLAHQIGGSIKDEADLLNGDVERYLAHRGDSAMLSKMKKHAMRLVHETREI